VLHKEEVYVHHTIPYLLVIHLYLVVKILAIMLPFLPAGAGLTKTLRGSSGTASLPRYSATSFAQVKCLLQRDMSSHNLHLLLYYRAYRMEHFRHLQELTLQQSQYQYCNI